MIYELEKLNLFSEKEIIVCNQIDEEIFECCGKNGKFEVDKKYMKQLKGKFKYKSKHILSDCLLCQNDKHYHKDINECYESIIRISNILKDRTNGDINLYKTGDLRSSILKLLLDKRKLNYDINKPELVKNYREYQWLMEASKGALIFCKDNFIGDIIQYDKNSYYPSVMLNKKFKIPVKEGEFIKLDELPEKFNEVGIYRCKIDKSSIYEHNYLFRYNNHNFYTNIDMKRAQSLNLSMELVKDGKENFLFYSEDKLIQSKDIFEEYIEMLFEMKKEYKKKNDEEISIYIKRFLSALWGVLCQKREFQYTIDYSKEDEIINMKDGDEIIKRHRYNENIDKITVINKMNPMETRFGRLKPFLLSLGRSIMSKLIEEDALNGNIVKIHTDGFCVINNDNKNTYKINNKLGGLKIEKQGKYNIQNVNKMVLV